MNESTERTTWDDDVVDWVRGTLLRPIVTRLAGAALEEFLASYRAAVRAEYTASPCGVWLPFPRLFFVARRA